MKKKIDKVKNFMSIIFLLPIILILIFIRIFLNIKIIEIETRSIGHFSYPIEIFLSEIKKNIHGDNIYFAFRNKVIANKFLYKKYKKNFIVIPRLILEPIFKFFNQKIIFKVIGKYFLGDYRHWTQNYTHEMPSQQVDIYGVLNKTQPSITFTEKESSIGYSEIEKINIYKNDNFICIHPRTPYFELSKNIIKSTLYQLRDSKKFNISRSVDYLNIKNIKSVFLGHKKNDFKDIKKIIYYNKSNIKNDFLDIFLLSKCKYLIGDSSGMSMAPLIFRKKSLYINFSELHSIDFADSIYKPIITIKKFKSLKNNHYISFHEVLEKKLSEVENTQILNDLGYEIEENSEEDIFQATKEMDYLIDNNEYLYRDLKLENKFDEMLIKFGIPKLKYSKISNYFLSKNIDLFH